MATDFEHLLKSWQNANKMPGMLRAALQKAVIRQMGRPTHATMPWGVLTAYIMPGLKKNAG